MAETKLERMRRVRAVACQGGCGLLSIMGQTACKRMTGCGTTVRAAYPEGEAEIERWGQTH